MFDKEFYPTPRSVIDQMLLSVDINNKVILEPSAGKGDIITALKEYGAKEIIACELNKDLAEIASKKADRFVCNDFFSVSSSDISHIDLIVMNPPFSNADKHILHAWEIAPQGCQIISLCNYETVNNSYSFRRNKLNYLVAENGKVQNLGDVFSGAERTTGVEIGLINLFKPKTGEDEFDGYFDLEEEYHSQQNGLMQHNQIEEVVNRYVGAVKMFDDVMESSERINSVIAPISHGNSKIKFGAYHDYGNNYNKITRDSFKKELQKQAWNAVFSKFNIEKYVTKSVLEKMNKFVEQQTKVPFTVKNIYKMIEMIIGTSESNMNEIIVEVFDKLTKHHHDNRFQVEGWKTNSEYMVNKKFIIDWGMISLDFNGYPEANWRNDGYVIDDLCKALCFVTGTNYNCCDNWSQFLMKERKDWGKWYEFNFFTLKMYKKGTVHVKFNDEKVWIEFNRRACKEKGFELASKYTSDFRRKANDIDIMH